MLILYNTILIIIAIITAPLIACAFIINPKYRAGFSEKIGNYSFEKNDKNTVVFHAVSVGETNAIKELVKRYHQKHPEENIVVTTTTKTGQEVAKNAFSNTAKKVTYFPYDFFFSVISFFNTFNPKKIIIAETEIWPGFITIAKQRGIKVYVVNGRISPHSYKGYSKIKRLIAPVLNSYEKIFMQSVSDSQRIIDIGAECEKVEVMGNLKFDVEQNLTQNQIEQYKNEFKSNDYRVLIAASTHKGEDEKVLSAYKTLKEKHADAKLIIAPRHPQRYDEVSALLDNSGFIWGKRSKQDNFEKNDIILLDTMGELSKLFSICYIAFIGGSSTQTGGHNPLEANIWGKPVISGNIIFNFKDVYKICSDKKSAVIVNSEEELTNEIISFYDNTLKYKTFCANANSIFDENRGAVNYVLDRI